MPRAGRSILSRLFVIVVWRRNGAVALPPLPAPPCFRTFELQCPDTAPGRLRLGFLGPVAAIGDRMAFAHQCRVDVGLALATPGEAAAIAINLADLAGDDAARQQQLQRPPRSTAAIDGVAGAVVQLCRNSGASSPCSRSSSPAIRRESPSIARAAPITIRAGPRRYCRTAPAMANKPMIPRATTISTGRLTRRQPKGPCLERVNPKRVIRKSLTICRP